MVVTVGAINKKEVNNLYKDHEQTGGEKPIDLVKATNPILIVDEPQSVDSGMAGRGKKALDSMHPLCTLRYSATHLFKHHMVYRLDAVDAYERQLVKQIEVALATVEDAHDRPYVRLISTDNRRGVIARVELDVEAAGHVRRTEKTVKDGDDLERTTGRTIYRDHRIGEIQVGKDSASVELQMPEGRYRLRKGEAWGDSDLPAVHRQMIRRTIREHFDKERRLRPQGIKVLSLFFVDAVERYRRYDRAGNAIKGEYAQIFESEYRRLASHPDYRPLFPKTDPATVAEQAHDDYFSIDKKGGWTDTAENTQSNRDNAERAYHLIMKDKEKLLNLDEPLRFIFSHSALREGWDNPNVFQICALRDIRTERERRQTIGRGLRLCVNQNGERQRGFEVNTLTVIARESYEEFAENLQREIEQDTGIRFGVVEPHQFASLPIIGDDGATTPFGFDESRKLYDHLLANGDIDAEGRIRNSLRKAIKDDAFALPERWNALRADIAAVLRKLSGRFEIKNADKRPTDRSSRAVLDSPEFEELWDRIKRQTVHHLFFDNDVLLKNSAAALQDADSISPNRLKWRQAEIRIGQAKIKATELADSETVTLEETHRQLPDLLTEIENRTRLTRRSIYKILIDSGCLEDFKHQPQLFIELAARAINGCKRQALTHGLKYRQIGNETYYAQELVQKKELAGLLKPPLATEPSNGEPVVSESVSATGFANRLDNSPAVKWAVGLPDWFTVPTPLGNFSPDWAALVGTEQGERLYLGVEPDDGSVRNNFRHEASTRISDGKPRLDISGNDQGLRPAWKTSNRPATA